MPLAQVIQRSWCQGQKVDDLDVTLKGLSNGTQQIQKLIQYMSVEFDNAQAADIDRNNVSPTAAIQDDKNVSRL